MHIMHLIDSGGLYGAEQMLLGLVRRCNQLGIKATIVSVGDVGVAEKPLETAAKAAGLPLVCLRMKNGLNFSGAKKIVQLAKSHGADLLHSHGYKFNILLGLLPRRWRLPCLTTVHGYVHSPLGSRMWCYEWLDRKMLPRLEQVVFVSEQTLQHPRVRGLKLANANVIANGLAPPTQRPADMTPLANPEIAKFVADSEFLILAVGRLSREKGFDTLLAAFAQLHSNHPHARLLIVGDGGQRAALESQVAALQLADAVLLPGFSEQVASVLAQAQLFVMPSLTEGLPMALLEAMAAEIPIIASAVGGIPQVLNDGECGELVPATDVCALQATMEKLMDDPARCNELTARAKQRQLSLFSVVAMADSYLTLYQNMLKRED
ncbi:glycosyltransferase [Corallincola luteus]|uniref:Glycosyltransferase n=1 Tax=Corallincola luteus TaxID=1775177 RepID=A0ABY2AMK3_9GAMM|nr:glycosyltransferase [Corallincola luteus]TCI04429.1 glycosyltransferase [Corallincola luteus]